LFTSRQISTALSKRCWFYIISRGSSKIYIFCFVKTSNKLN
jgi:hypothetical protein